MSAGYGYIACFIAIFCYGSNFLPVKVDIFAYQHTIYILLESRYWRWCSFSVYYVQCHFHGVASWYSAITLYIKALIVKV